MTHELINNCAIFIGSNLAWQQPLLGTTSLSAFMDTHLLLQGARTNLRWPDLVTEKSVVASRKQKFTVAAFRGKSRWTKTTVYSRI